MNVSDQTLFRINIFPLPAIALLMLATLLVTSSQAIAQFTLTGELRPRAEFRNGFKRPQSETDDPAFFIEQRSRLYFDYKSPRIALAISLQDVRVWGNTAQIYKADPSLHNLREAWGEYSFSGTSSIKVGRQALSYDNERFLGALEWAQQGRVHDALLLKFRNDSSTTRFHAGAAFNQNVPNEPSRLASTFYNGVDNYKTMQFVWFHKDYRHSGLSLLILNDGRQRIDSSMYFRQTYGFITKRKIGKITAEAELYHQGGRSSQLQNNKVSAWLASFNIGFRDGRFPLIAGIDHLSGTSPYTSRNRAFDPSFGTNHAFYGLMDHFYVGNPHGQEGRITGLTDLYVKGTIKTSPRSNLKVDVHYFRSPARIQLAESGNVFMKPGLGSEVDFVYTMLLSEGVTISIGYSQLFATSSLMAIKGNNGDSNSANNWAWTMLTIKPVLLKEK
jgi:hypothetical protein